MSATPKQLYDAGNTRSPVLTDMLTAQGTNGKSFAATMAGIVALIEAANQGFKRIAGQTAKVDLDVSNLAQTIFTDVNVGSLTIPDGVLDGSVGSEIWIRVPLKYTNQAGDYMTLTATLTVGMTIYELFAVDVSGSDNMVFRQDSDEDVLIIRIIVTNVAETKMINVFSEWRSNLDFKKNKLFNLEIGSAGPWVLDIQNEFAAGGGSDALTVYDVTVDAILIPVAP